MAAARRAADGDGPTLALSEGTPADDDEGEDLEAMSFEDLVELMDETGGPTIEAGTPLDEARDVAWTFLERTFTDSHDHSHAHDGDSSAVDRFGIGSFVYEARRPFEPSRLARVAAALPIAPEHRDADADVDADVEAALRGVLRSKGFAWLANDHDSAVYWSHAGHRFETRLAGPWRSAADADADLPDAGDRRQEIIFIGTGLDGEARSIIVAALDACLLDDTEMARYPGPPLAP